MTTNFSPVQALKFKLAGGGITSSATTIILQSFQSSTGTNLVTADFGAIGYLVIEPGTSRMETVSFTTVTQNSDGTATLTGVTRGLGHTTPFTEVSANKFAHSGGSIVVLSNPAAFYNKFPAKANDEAITGYWTVPTPLGANDIVNKAYADALAMSGTGVSTDSVKVAGTAGETIAAGNVVYLKASDGRWWLADADLTATIDSVQLGIAQGAGTAGNPITGGVLLSGVDTNQSGLSVGNSVFVSNTAGGISSSAGTNPRVIGVVKSTTSIYFDPHFQNRPTNYAVDAVGTDSYEITLPAAYNAYYAGMTISFKPATANTGAATLAVNGGAAKTIKKNGSEDLVTGDILANQVCLVVYDGTNFQMISSTPSPVPVVRVYNPVAVSGDSTTQFDVTNPSGTTFRYTYDTTGTDPGISAVTFPTGTPVDIQGQNFNAANNGFFLVTSSGANFFEVTNASGVVESNKTLGTGYLLKGATWTKPTGLRYAVVEVQGAGGGTQGTTSANNNISGAGAGGYSRKTFAASALSASEYYVVGYHGLAGSGTGGDGTSGARSVFGLGATFLATGGAHGTISAPGNPGVGSGGDINSSGQGGCPSGDGADGEGFSGAGGSSVLGGGGRGAVRSAGDTVGQSGGAYGGGAGGPSCGSGGDVAGGIGGDGVIIVTEYY